MFDAKTVTEDVLAQVGWHVTRLGMRLSWGGAFDPGIMMEAYKSCPLHEEIRILVQVANGEIDRETAEDLQIGEIAETVQDVVEFLCAPPYGANVYRVPSSFWGTPIGEVVALCQAWLQGEDLISYDQAARMLFADEYPADLSQKAAVARVRRLVEREELRRYVAPDEPNPTHSGRVSRREVENLANKKAND